MCSTQLTTSTMYEEYGKHFLIIIMPVNTNKLSLSLTTGMGNLVIVIHMRAAF